MHLESYYSMNFHKSILYITVSLLSTTALAQEFQQQVDHKIAVQLNDEAHTLSGNIATTYQNNSKDTLHHIYYHLYPNAYKNNSTAFAKQYLADGNVDFHYNKPEDRGFIDSLNFHVNGQYASVEQTANIDVVKLILPKPLLPGKSVQITTPFFVKLPKVYSRLGHNKQEYQISQWFPKPAVYDKNGWNAFPYLNLGEYYSDFGNYEVKIKVPENYVVLATGNIEEESEQNWLLQKSKEKVTTGAPSSTNWKTITFKESQVHDFAWFASKDWAVQIAKLKIKDTNKEVTAYVGHNPAHTKGWKDVMQYIQNTLDTYSEHVGTYPYQTVKVAEGALEAGGGMEYPTVTVIQQSNEPDFVEQVTVHEVGHNWFYGILANNERTSPWLDESINSFYERKTVSPSMLPSSGIMDAIEQATLQAYNHYHSLQPLCSHSAHLTNLNYGLDLYQKGPDYIAYLEAYMGADAFKKGMRQYFDNNKFKHVDAAKLQTALAAHTDKNLDWFFNDLIQKSETVNFGVKKTNNGFKITNKTSFDAPAGLETINAEDKYTTTSLEMIPAKGNRIFHSDDKVGMLNENIADYQTNNNKSNQKGIRLNALIPLHPQAGHNIAIAPSLGYNYNNGFMLGGMLHNIGLPQQKFEFIVAPMYGFKSKSLAGHAYMGYNQYTGGLFQHVKYSVNVKHYASDVVSTTSTLYPNFTTIKPEVYIDFKKKNPRSTKQHSLILRGHFIFDDAINYAYDSLAQVYNISKGDRYNRNYFTADYIFENAVTLNPYKVRAYTHMGTGLLKVAAEADIKILYNAKKDAVHLRGFAGIMKESNYSYGLHTINNYRNDYLYEDVYLKRNQQTGLFANQTYQREGGFYTSTLLYAMPLGMSTSGLLALNTKVDIPHTPLQLFGNMAYAFSRENEMSFYNPLNYEMGVVFKATPFIDIAFPIIVSKELYDYRRFYLGKNSFAKSISFRINITDWNASRFIQKKMMGIRM